jgi:hypothetical protein
MVTNDTHSTTTEEPKKGEALARNFIAGHPQGSVRRIALYVTVALSLVLAATAAPMAISAAALAVGLTALLLLATTDQLA